MIIHDGFPLVNDIIIINQQNFIEFSRKNKLLFENKTISNIRKLKSNNCPILALSTIY